MTRIIPPLRFEEARPSCLSHVANYLSLKYSTRPNAFANSRLCEKWMQLNKTALTQPALHVPSRGAIESLFSRKVRLKASALALERLSKLKRPCDVRCQPSSISFPETSHLNNMFGCSLDISNSLGFVFRDRCQRYPGMAASYLWNYFNSCRCYRLVSSRCVQVIVAKFARHHSKKNDGNKQNYE